MSSRSQPDPSRSREDERHSRKEDAASRRQDDVLADQQASRVEEGLKPEPAVEDRLHAPGFVIKRILVNVSFYFSWLPYIVVVSARERDFQNSLIFGTAFSGFCVLFQAGMWQFRLKREFPYILDMTFLVYFIIYTAIQTQRPDYYQTLFDWELVILHLWLCFAMLVTVAARYPFTIQYAKEVAPEEAWAAESFCSVCDHMAGTWAGFMGLTGLLCLAPTLTQQNTDKHGLNVVFNYLWPILTLLTLTVGTRVYPAMIRSMYYVPRMLNNSVKPDTKAGGQPITQQGTDAAASQQQSTSQQKGTQGANRTSNSQGLSSHQGLAANVQGEPGQPRPVGVQRVNTPPTTQFSQASIGTGAVQSSAPSAASQQAGQPAAYPAVPVR